MMDVANMLSTGFIRWTEIDQPAQRPGNSVSQSPSVSASTLPNYPNRKIESRELCSVVEQEFRHLNKNHDRIRTEMLCANDAGKK